MTDIGAKITHMRDVDFARLCAFMQGNFGLKLDAKRKLVEGRLAAPAMAAGFADFHGYIDDMLGGDAAKTDFLITKLTTNYTYFMRESAHYDFLSRTALPEWESKIGTRDLRTWSAGCASGEEPYTIAMVLAEHFGGAAPAWDTTVLATDISTRALETAAKGVYTQGQLKHLPAIWRAKYFAKKGDDYEVTSQLKKGVILREFNLMDGFERFQKRFHIIFCRNVMIYFDNATRAELSRKFYDLLEPGGYLFIGLSETISSVCREFKRVEPAIYRK
jgi:chemotaxis protein methyltransferase CheR